MFMPALVVCLAVIVPARIPARARRFSHLRGGQRSGEALGYAFTVPLSPDKLSVLYRQLAQQLAAGLTLAQALRAP
ncbi:MAG: hypothetical protein RLZZ50_1832, partial [Verrucomicrobiota bacterium]